MEDLRERCEVPAPAQLDAMRNVGRALDRHRPHGAKDLRTVLDRTFGLARDLAVGRVETTSQAWAAAPD